MHYPLQFAFRNEIMDHLFLDIYVILTDESFCVMILACTAGYGGFAASRLLQRFLLLKETN